MLNRKFFPNMKFKIVVNLVMLAIIHNIKLREEAQEKIQFYTVCVNGKYLPYVPRS